MSDDVGQEELVGRLERAIVGYRETVDRHEQSVRRLGRIRRIATWVDVAILVLWLPVVIAIIGRWVGWWS